MSRRQLAPTPSQPAQSKRVKAERDALRLQNCVEIAGDPSGRLLVKVPEIMHLLSLSETTVYKLARNGTLPTIKLGDALLFPLAEIKALIKAGTTP